MAGRDDEISANYVASLVELLEADPRSVIGAGHRPLMRSEQAGELMSTSSYPQQSAVVRALQFIYGDLMMPFSTPCTGLMSLVRRRFAGIGGPTVESRSIGRTCTCWIWCSEGPF